MRMPSKSEDTPFWDDPVLPPARVTAEEHPVERSRFGPVVAEHRVPGESAMRARALLQAIVAGSGSTGGGAKAVGPVGAGPAAAAVPGGTTGNAGVKILVGSLPVAIGLVWIGRIVILRRTTRRARQDPIDCRWFETTLQATTDLAGPVNAVVHPTARQVRSPDPGRHLQPRVSTHTPCARCRYDLFGCLVGERCPECGQSIIRGLRRPSPRRWFGRWRRRRPYPVEASNTVRRALAT